MLKQIKIQVALLLISLPHPFSHAQECTSPQSAMVGKDLAAAAQLSCYAKTQQMITNAEEFCDSCAVKQQSAYSDDLNNIKPALEVLNGNIKKVESDAKISAALKNKIEEFKKNNDFEQRLKDKAKQFQTENKCMNGVESEFVKKAPYGSYLALNSNGDDAVLDELAAVKNKKREEKLKIMGLVKQKEDDLNFCADETQQTYYDGTLSSHTPITVVVDVAAYFKNNEAKLDDAQTKAVRAAIQSQVNKDLPENCRQIAPSSIDIEVSSNHLRNSKDYGSWDFEKLSHERAEFIKEAIIKKVDHVSDKTKIKTKFGGAHGVSGPCPYEVVGNQNMRTVRLKKMDEKLKSELEKAKYAKVVLRYPNTCQITKVLEKKGKYLKTEIGNCIGPKFTCN